MNRRRRTSGSPETSTLVLLARLAGVGWYVAISIAGGAMTGAWLDARFNTRPALLLTGLAIGVILAFLGMLRLLKWFAAGGSDAGDSE